MINKNISFVIPVYKNELSILDLYQAINSEMDKIGKYNHKFYFVNDGSTDKSWKVLTDLQKIDNSRVVLINLTRNFGQIAALLAGFTSADGDATISISADMQDPPTLIKDMLAAWEGGNKLVIGTRASRDDGLISDFFSNLFWSILKKFAVPEIPAGGFDYFLMDKIIRRYYIDNPEQDLFMQGRLLYYGVKPYEIPYSRQVRRDGKSETTLIKKIKYFTDAFSGYSFLPIRLISLFSVLTFFVSIGLMLWILFDYLLYGNPVKGWASITVLILFFNGLQLLVFGVIGEYLWRAIKDIRKRPIFIVDLVIDNSKPN